WRTSASEQRDERAAFMLAIGSSTPVSGFSAPAAEHKTSGRLLRRHKLVWGSSLAWCCLRRLRLFNFRPAQVKECPHDNGDHWPFSASTGRLAGPPTLNRSESKCWGLPSRAFETNPLDELRIVLALAAADLNQHRRLEVDPWSLDVVAYVVAVLLRRELAGVPFSDIDLQARDAYVSWRGLVRYLKGFLEELVSLRLARARLSQHSPPLPQCS